MSFNFLPRVWCTFYNRWDIFIKIYILFSHSGVLSTNGIGYIMGNQRSKAIQYNNIDHVVGARIYYT